MKRISSIGSRNLIHNNPSPPTPCIVKNSNGSMGVIDIPKSNIEENLKKNTAQTHSVTMQKEATPHRVTST